MTTLFKLLACVIDKSLELRNDPRRIEKFKLEKAGQHTQ